MKASSILGLNARSQNFSYPYNAGAGKSIATSKLKTAKVLTKAGIPTPNIYAKFRRPQNLLGYDWSGLPASFVLKPSKGLGGEGIIVIKKRAKEPNSWITATKKKVTVADLQLHILDIIEGAYSMSNVPDTALLQEYVGRHKALRKYSYRGTPDIRVIVFNKVPVMAMLRLPTKESGGRGNLFQGAIAVGIDIATGITTHAFLKGKYIRTKPGTNRKLHGIKIPQWDRVLEISVLVSEVSKLGYLGVDVVFHPEKGPMVLELNYQPGLKIQFANKAGLRKRLERVEDLEVRDPQHGAKLAKALFAARFSDRVMAKQGVKTLSIIEQITIRAADKKKVKVAAKIDTGAWRTSISRKLAKDLGLLAQENVLWSKNVKSALGLQKRQVINLTFWMAGRKITTPASVAKRLGLKYPVIVGRKNLKGVLVDPNISAEEKREKSKIK